MPASNTRTLFSSIASIAVLLCLPAHGQGQALIGRTTRRNMKAQDFMNSFGVNIHFDDNNYRSTQAIADALNTIGFSRIRCNCETASDVASWNDIASKAAAYFPDGLKADVLVTSYRNDPNTFAQQQQTVTQIAPLIETIEGPNEINNYYVGLGTHGPFDTPNAAADANGNWYPTADDQTKNFPANYAAWAKALSDWKTGVPALANARLIGPTIASGLQSDYAQLPNIASEVSTGTLHFYAGNGRQPSNFGGGDFPNIYDWYRAAASPGKPVTVSEWGQTTASKPGQDGCDNATQAKYILNQMFDLTAKNAYRSYLYQLMDDTPDGDPTGAVGTEAHFGIFDYQWHIKPAGQALANVKTLLADTTTDFKQNIPRYTVSGITNPGGSGSHLSISKSDGSTFVVVWNEPQIWDQNANAPVTPPADPVTVSFGGTFTYKVFDPLVGISAIAAGSGLSVTVNVTGSPMMIQLTP